MGKTGFRWVGSFGVVVLVVSKLQAILIMFFSGF